MSAWLPALIGYAICLVCCVAWWPRTPRRPRPDYEKIARLEVELGLVPPLPQTQPVCWYCGDVHFTITCDQHEITDDIQS